MEPSDIPLMLPLTDMAMSIFKDTLDELPALKSHEMVRIGNVCPTAGGIVLGPISSRPNTAGLAAVATGGAAAASMALNDGRNGVSAGTVGTERVTTAGGGDGSNDMPSTAQSSKKPLSQQTNRSGKGAAAPPAATQMASTVADDFAAALALKDIVSGDGGDAGAGSGRHQHHAPLSFADDNDPWLAAAEVVAEDEAAFLEASAPSLAWAKRRSTFFSEKPSSSYLIEDILGEFVPASEVPEPAPYTIDAIGMAKDYSTGLEAKYGYKVPRGLHEVGKVTPRKYDAENTRYIIGQHDSGGAVPSPPFTGAETIKRNQQLEEEEAELAATALLSASGKLKSPAPPSTLNKSAARRTQLRAADNDIAEDSKLDAATINKQQTKLKTSLARPQLQCNFETIELRAGPRQTQELVLELWNTSAYSLRVKIARSPWLPQLTVEPLNPSTYNPEASVAPGTSLLVRVAFCPTEASVADCEKDLKLSFGYTREVNETRNTDQAFLTQQWSFLDIAVKCLTVLPQPQMYFASQEDASAAQQQQIKEGAESHASNPLVFGFSPIFATTTTSLIRVLQNIGSRGVFRIQSSRPEVFITSHNTTPSLSSPNCVVLDRGESIAVGVLFAPKFAGTYAETLTITVHDEQAVANNSEGDAEVLSTITCRLEGIAVVPSVVVESIGDNGRVLAPTHDKKRRASNGAVVAASEEQNSLLGAAVPFGVIEAAEKQIFDAQLTGIAVDTDGESDDGGFAATTAVVDPPLALFRDAAALHQSKTTVVLRNDGPLPLPFAWALQTITGGSGPEAEFTVVPATGSIPPNGGRVVVQVAMTPQTDDVVTGLLSLFLQNMPTAEDNESDDATTIAKNCWRSRRRLVPNLEKPHIATSLTDPFGLFQERTRQQHHSNLMMSEDSAAAADVEQRCGCVVQRVQQQQLTDLFAAAIRVVADPKPLRVVVHPTRIESGVECLTNHQNDRTFTLTNHSPRDVRFWLDPCTDDANHPGTVLTNEKDIAAKKKHERQMRDLFGKDWMPSSQRKREGCTLEFFPQCGVLQGNTSLEVHCKMTLERLGHHSLDIECFIDALGREASPSISIIADAVGPSVHSSHALLDFGVIAVGEEAEARFTVTNHNPVKVAFQVMDPLPCDPARFVFLPERASLLPGKSIDVTVYRQGILSSGGKQSDDDTQCFIEVVVEEGGTTAVECRATIQQPAAVVTPVNLNLGDMDCAIARESEVFLTNLSAIDIPFTLEILQMPHTMSLLIPQSGVLFGGQYKASIKIKAQFNGISVDTAVVAIRSPKLPEPILFEVTCAKVRPIAVALSTTMLRGDEPLVTSTLSMETFISELLMNLVTTEVLRDADVAPLFPHCPSVVIPYASIADDDPFCAVQTRLRIDNKSGCYSAVVVSGLSYIPLRSPFRAPASTKVTDAARVATPPPPQHPHGGASGTGGGDRGDGSSSVLSGTRRTLNGSHARTHRGGGASSVGGASTPSVSQRIMKLKPDMPSYECKAIDGREGIERERETLREYAQSMLLDGRGCSLLLQNAVGPLKPHGTHDVTATLIANLPGKYRETLRIECEGVPPVALDMELVVQGRPVLADPTTSGLATNTADGSLKLTLPSVVAGMSKTRRRLRIASRCPRDLEVRIGLQSLASSFQVSLDDSDALRLLPPPADGDEQQVAFVTPSTLLLPALGSSEIVVEFSPSAAMLGGEWKAQLTMSSRIAKTEYNDIFLLDEFYLVNAERYPAERAITALGLVQQNNANNGGGGGSGGGGGVRSVSKLNVQQPLLDRPAILKDNRFLQPSASEKLILDLYKRQQLRATTPPVRASSTSDLINGGVAGNSSFSMRGQLPPAVVPVASGSAAALTPSASTAVADDSDDEDDDAMNVVSNMAGKGGNGTDSKEALLAQDVERTELMDFIARRREELHCTLDDRYLTPTTITVVGVVMAAKLQCDPPEVLRFPLCKAGETASRAIRLTNPTRTPLDFRVRMDGPFRITRLDFIPADGEEDLLSEDDEEGKNATRNTRKLLLGSTKGLAANNQTLKSAVPTAKNALLASSTPSSLASTKRTDPNSDPANTLFHLRPRDSVDLTVELSGLSTTSQQHKHALDGALTVLFQGCPLTQVVPCLATVHTPSLVCDPEQTWFRPPVVIRDGKPQPKYPRNITLVNHSNCPAPFSVRHMARMDAPGGARVGSAGGGETLQRLKKVQAVVATTPLEEHAQLFDDPSRFTIFPMNGVVPAATKGGAPGRLVIQIQFHEYSFMKYESRFRVDVEGGVGSDFVVRGDSREVEV